MAKFTTQLLAFNRGLISALGLARIDLKRTALSAETYLNWIPRALGSMMLRPGLKYITKTTADVQPVLIPFIFSSTDTAIIELTNLSMRVLVSEAAVTRVAVSTVVTNGNFDTDLTGWTNADETGATSDWAVGWMRLLGTGTNAAIRKQTLTVSGGDQNKVHALNIDIVRGPVLLRVGSTDGGDEYISETTLGKGKHSLSFTPTAASVYIQLFNRVAFISAIESINIAGSGEMTLVTPWVTADLANIRTTQSGDVIFCAASGVIQQKIERRNSTSWSIVEFFGEDGPFLPINVTPIRMTPSGLTGEITLTASKPYFKSSNIGSLFKLISVGQTVTVVASGQDQFTGSILITGIGNARNFAVITTGTWVGTLRLQRSPDAPGAWVDYKSTTVNVSYAELDGLDNQVMYYRMGFKTGEYTSGSATITLQSSSGSIIGIMRIFDFTSSTVVTGNVLKDMGNTTSTDDWEEGAWSARRGYPSSVVLHEGRLWWAGKDHIWGSVSDAFGSYDETKTSSSGPISRSIGQGPVDTINWLMSSLNLIVGGQGAEYLIRSSSIDDPLTPSNFNMKITSTLGSKGIPALNLDQTVVFVQRGGSRVYELGQKDQYSGYVTNDLTSVVPDIGSPGITRIAVQRQPDARIHCVRSDGTVAILVYDSGEQIRSWINFDTDGSVVDVIVLPSDIDSLEDKVYYVVKRTIGGVDKYHIERWATEAQCQGGLLNRQADSYVEYDGASTVTITGLSHLNGKTVVIWADGKDVGTKVVASGSITLDTAASKVIAGLSYTAKFKSSKLAYQSEAGSPLGQRKRVDHLGLVLYNTHYKGLKYGKDFSNLDDMPDSRNYEIQAADTVYSTYDDSAFEFPGVWDTDSRLHLQAAAPRPVTVLALTITMAENDKL